MVAKKNVKKITMMYKHTPLITDSTVDIVEFGMDDFSSELIDHMNNKGDKQLAEGIREYYSCYNKDVQIEIKDLPDPDSLLSSDTNKNPSSEFYTFIKFLNQASSEGTDLVYFYVGTRKVYFAVEWDWYFEWPYPINDFLELIGDIWWEIDNGHNSLVLLVIVLIPFIILLFLLFFFF
ncbi:MAG: hypothetical protein FWH29_02930 [Methanobrevibacter sp.]|nr:hypothetical protein [Methanobrevibacter sp.]